MHHLKQLPNEIYRNFKSCHIEVPAIESAHRFIDELVVFLFPVKANKNVSLKSLQKELRHLRFLLEEILHPLFQGSEESIQHITSRFFDQLPAIYHKLVKDADVFVNSDPSARSLEEVIMSFPGFHSIAVYRIAHQLHQLKVPLLPRIIAEYIHGKTGIDIHPGALIGENFFIDHGTGVVIGETTEIGNNVKIYQGVTLGALYVERDMVNQKRHPTIQDNVIIYAGSTILGGKTVVGHDSVIGGNVWLNDSVEPYSLVYHKPEIFIRDKKDFVEPINFYI